MELKEFFVQSVGPFYSATKFSFKKGLNVIYGRNGTGKTTLSVTLLSLFDEEFSLKNREKLKPWVPQDTPPRAGIIFTRENRVFKYLKDFESGGSILQEKKDGKFTPVARGKEIENLFIDELDLPIAGDLREMIYIPEKIEFPVTVESSTPAFESSPFEGFEMASEPHPSENREERLKILKEELERAERIEELEFKMEGLEQKLFDLNEKVGEIKEIEKEVEKLNAFINKYSEIQNFPVDFKEKLEKVKDLEREAEELEEELKEKEEELGEEVESIKSSFKKYQRDPKFIAAVVVTLLGFILPNVTHLPGWFVFFGLGGIVFTVYLITVFYPSHEKTIKEKEENAKTILDEEKKKIKSIRDEVKVFYELGEYLGVSDPKEIGKLIDGFWASVRKREELEKELQRKKEEINYEEVEEKRREIEEEISRIKEELQELGRPTMDINTLKQEIAKLEGKKEAPETTPDVGFSTFSDQGFEAMPVEENNEAPQVFKKLLQLGEKLSRRTTDQLIAGVQDRFDRYLTFLSNRRFIKATIEEDYSITFTCAPADREVRWHLLSEGDLMIIYLALYLSIVELVSLNRNLPLIVDNSFSQLDDSTFTLLLKLLRKMGEKIQIILFSGREIALKAAHHSLKLGDLSGAV